MKFHTSKWLDIDLLICRLVLLWGGYCNNSHKKYYKNGKN